jgi:ABC-type transporter Mla maintaining outer membrane lipid asymmetry permease subunit MlaE
MTMKEEYPIVPIVVSILAGIAWAIFILIHTLFWSDMFNTFQNIVITIVSFIVVGALVGLMWVVWGFRVTKREMK